jgi:hypothetical protein
MAKKNAKKPSEPAVERTSPESPATDQPKANNDNPEPTAPPDRLEPADAILRALRSLGADASDDDIKRYCGLRFGYKPGDWGNEFDAAKKCALESLGFEEVNRPVKLTLAGGTNLRDLVEMVKAVKAVVNEFGVPALKAGLVLVERSDVETVREVLALLEALEEG